MAVSIGSFSHSMCRICMQEAPNVFSIFDKVFPSDDNKTIADIISECTNYPVLLNDKLPTAICSECIELARNAHTFKRQTEQAYCQLKALYDIAWTPKKTELSVTDSATQTDKCPSIQCEQCQLNFNTEEELRVHATDCQLNAGRTCKICGEILSHSSELQLHMSSIHPNEVKCHMCLRQFTRKDHLKRHLENVHQIQDDRVNMLKVSLEEPEIHLGKTDNAENNLNDYSSHWSDFQDAEADTVHSNSRNSNITPTNPFSSDDEDSSEHNTFNNMDDEEVKTFVETFTHPVISIKVEFPENEQLQDKKPVEDSISELELISIKAENRESKVRTDEETASKSEISQNELLEDEHRSDSQTSDEDEEKGEEEEEFVDTVGSNRMCSKKKTGSKEDNVKGSLKKMRNKKTRRRHGVANVEESRCKQCNRSFSRYNHLLRHMLTHSDEKPHVCKYCNKGFSRTDHLQKHIQSIHCEKNFKCDQCDSAYGRKDHLLRHIETRHNKNPSAPRPQFECDMCEKKFTTKTYLARHKLLHTDRLYACKHCPETFAEKEHIKEHVKRAHSQPRNFLCSICGDSFQRNEYLKIHMRRHTGEKPYKCRFCDKGFPRSTDLKMHERYHIGLKPNLCNLCGKGFHRPYNLTIHMRTHTGEKPYKCNQCPQAFAQSNDLKAHIRRHTGERFRCDVCGAQFLQRYGLNAHLRSVHGVVVTSFTGRLRKNDQADDGKEAADSALISDDLSSLAQLEGSDSEAHQLYLKPNQVPNPNVSTAVTNSTHIIPTLNSSPSLQTN